MTNEEIRDELELVSTHNIWLSALFSSIKRELNTGRTYQAERLAEIGQYLAEDCQYYIDEQIEAVK